MIRSYLKIAWRNITRNKAYAFINVFGLALGIACSIVIFAFVNYQTSFDNFHKDPEKIYRFITHWRGEEGGYSQAVPSPLGKAFRTDYQYAEKIARVIDYYDAFITLEGNNGGVKKFREEQGIVYTEPEFFDILNFPLVKGDSKTMLSNPNSAVITQKLAKKYFGDADPIGKKIRVNNQTDFLVTGVLKDLPPNTDRLQEIYVSFHNLKERNAWIAGDSAWTGVYSGSQLFVKLKPNVTKAQVDAGLRQIVVKNYNERDQKSWGFEMQPLRDIHMNTEIDGSMEEKYLWAFSFIGLFLIITACVNFINLATAQALNRSKEIGVRKVLGSLPSQLFWQFIAETAVITLMAILLALVFAHIGLPFVNSLFQTQIELHVLTNAPLLLFILAIGIFVTFLSGSYPGLILARFQPVLALKSKLSQKHIGGFSLRRVLVVTQFAISQMLIIGTIVIAGQMHHTRNSDLGFRKDAIVDIPIPINDKTKMTTLRSRFAGLAGVEEQTLCYAPPAWGSNNTTEPRFDTRAENEHWGINLKYADDNYLKTFGMKLVAGRNIFPADTVREFLVNETFVKKVGLKSPEEAIGKKLGINNATTSGLIVGVVKDFNNYSFRSDISAICIMPSTSQYRNLAVKINMKNAQALLPSFEKIWNETYPEYFYTYQFVDARIAQFYERDGIMLKLIEVFAGIAVLIGSLGLYGLVSFMAVRRTKEIGLRKVLGASMQNILWLFGREFTKLLIVAFVIAAPLAWWAMSKYLQDFKNRIPMHPAIFALAIVATFLIAALTVGYRSLKAAKANPVKSLRTE